jgi:hypothetical protein
MSYPINYPTPQNANIQIFNANLSTSTGAGNFCWVKPQGASFVWFTLIGAGGGGAGSDGASFGGGGGSAAVLNCMVPAFLIPDELTIVVAQGGLGGPTGGNAGSTGGSTRISYSDGTSYTLLNCRGGNGGIVGSPGTGGIVSASNYFSCMGFYQSVAGQDGGGASSVSASATTFLSGGAQPGVGGVAANYGYTTGGGSKQQGFFQTQPMIVGLGGGTDTSTKAAIGGIGCGGGGSDIATSPAGGNGGNGLVVIITW